MTSPHSGSCRVIATAQELAGVISLNEIQKVDPTARRVKALDSTASLIELSVSFRQLIDAFRQSPPIFLRHMFPVQCILPWKEDATDLSPLFFLVESMMPDQRASVQARFSFSRSSDEKQEKEPPLPFTLIHRLMDSIESLGITYSKKSPQQILSLYFDREMLYAGLSSPEDNLSAYNGGRRMYRTEEDQISRAEFKLLEALEIFKIPAAAQGQALDLGAAPGGWTRVLLERGYSVTAVDPAALDDRLLSHPRLTHFRDVSQNYTGSPGSVDLLVNDMRMDPSESARIMCDVYPLLKKNGQAIMTLKLAKKQWFKQTQKALQSLKRVYSVKGVRQLFNNRSEVTVWMTTE